MAQVTIYKLLPKYFYRPQHTLQTIALSSYERQDSVGYFSLPMEIRDSIMELVLTVGDIQLQFTEIDKKMEDMMNEVEQRLGMPFDDFKGHFELGQHSNLQPPGLQFLATCKQACAEGFKVFFSTNIFFLPYGPLENTCRYFKEINLEHQLKIQGLGLMFGVQDLTPLALRVIHGDIQAYYYPFEEPFAAGERRGMIWGEHSGRHLLEIWKQKLGYLRGLPVGMRKVKIGNSSRVQEWEGPQVDDALAGQAASAWSKELTRMKSDAGKEVEMLVRAVVEYGDQIGLVVLENMAKKGWAVDFLDAVLSGD